MRTPKQTRTTCEARPAKRGQPIHVRIVCLCLALGLVGPAVITAAQEGDPASISAALALRAEALIMARCAVCHSEDLIIQQRLPRNRWEKTVEKMAHWGAEILPGEADLLVRYLSARYHPAAPDHLPLMDSELRQAETLKQEPALTGMLVGDAGRGAGIFEHNCQACHGIHGSGGMGPKLAKNPILKHEDRFWETVLRGRGPMPAWGSFLNQQDVADIYAWLMSR
ncbi:MAG: c-type cytochrome [Nitrospira sp.]|nr:c-type cytochrome [Nitrospira sp.]